MQKNSKPCKPWRCQHTYISTFIKVRRVANEATLFDVENRLFVALYEEKNKVLEIACFLRAKKLNIMREFYTRIMTISNLAEVGGVE